MTTYPASATSDVIAPRCIIIPMQAPTGYSISGALFVSGATLLRFNGTVFRTIQEA